MNLLGLEINAVGNHEFDEGADELLRMQRGGCRPGSSHTWKGGELGMPHPFGGARFPFLAANVAHKKSHETLFPPYAIKRYGGVPVAFIGLTLRGTARLVHRQRLGDLVFRNEADTVNALVPELRKQGVEAIVVLLHEGGRQSGGFDECEGMSGPVVGIVERLASEIDLVITGHTHQAYICRLPNRSGKKIPVTSAGSYGRLLTEIDVTLDPRTHDIASAKARNIEVRRDAFPPHREVAKLVDGYARLAAPLAQRVVGRIAASITRDVDESGEAPLGRLVADAQLEATRDADAEIAFANMGGMRADLTYRQSKGEGDGNVTYAEIYAAQPFANALVTMTLTGKQIKSALENQFGCPRERGRPRLLQVSQGFQYAWNPDGRACERIVPGSMRLRGVAIEPGKRYRVTVNDYLAEGGDGFAVFKKGAQREGGPLDRDALASYLERRSPVALPGTPRIALAR